MHTRRQFLGTLGAITPFTILHSGGLHGATNAKLSVAFIGMGGQIQGHVANLLQRGHHVAAICDVDARQLASSRQRHGDGLVAANDYEDYRKLFESEKSIDAVVIATPDHWHAPLCRAAMEAGKHVYCEKPLAHTVAEARDLRLLARSSNVITQLGNQGSASSNLRRSIELIRAGLLGEVTRVHAWHPAHGWPCGEDRPSGEDAIPPGLNWDFWLGTAPVRPFKEEIYHPGKWRGWYDFGNGSLGDFCCHSFNLPLRALNLDYPNRIEVTGEGLGKESYAKSCTTRLKFPQREGRGPVELIYYTGGPLPPEHVTNGLIATFGSIDRVGCVIEGSQGHLSAGLWNSQCYLRMAGEEKYRGADNHDAAKAVPETLPRVKDHLGEWLDACQGGPRVFSDFDFGGHLTEIGLAGNVALRLQHNIGWDGELMRVPGEPNADRLIRPEARQAWL